MQTYFNLTQLKGIVFFQYLILFSLSQAKADPSLAKLGLSMGGWVRGGLGKCRSTSFLMSYLQSTNIGFGLNLQYHLETS